MIFKWQDTELIKKLATQTPNLFVNDQQMQPLNPFNYWASFITSDSKREHEIKQCIGTAKNAFQTMNFKQNQAGSKILYTELSHFVHPVLLHECEHMHYLEQYD